MKYFLLVLLVIILGCSEKQESAIEENAAKNQQTEVTKEEKAIIELTEKDTLKEESVESEKIVKEDKKDIEEEKEVEYSEAELWERYRQAKDALELAKEKNNWKEMKKQLIIAGQSAELLDRSDIAAWQYNNVGYYSIEEFKEVTDYFTLLDKINKLEYGKKKQEAYKKMVELFSKNFYILEDADVYLKQAEEIDSKLDDEIRTKRIMNNIAFIDEIRELVKKDEN